MTEQKELFRQAYDALIEQMPEPPDLDSIFAHRPRRAIRSGTPSWVAALGTAVVAIAVVGGLSVGRGAERTHDSSLLSTRPTVAGTGATTTALPTITQSQDFLFDRPLPWTLVFDNGSQNVLAVDTNTGVSYGNPIVGQRGGDQRYRLTLVDGHLVVGWGEIRSYEVATAASVALGSATIYVPAAEPDRVWLVDYDGSIGANPPRVWQVSVDGEVLTDPVTLETDGYPVIGLPNGLALETDNGIVIWDETTGEIIKRLGEGPALVSDTTPDGRLAWCHADCFTMNVTTVGGKDLAISVPDGEDRFVPGSGRFSSDGRYLAAVANGDVVVVDLSIGEAQTVMHFDGAPPSYVRWAPESHDLFASTDSYGQRSVTLGYFNADDYGETSVTDLPYGGTLGFVVVPTHEADSLLFGNGSACPVTIPNNPGLVPPKPWAPVYTSTDGDYYWYGTESLWTVLPSDANDYAPRKSVWWSTKFGGGSAEPSPEISVTWRRLDTVDTPVIANESKGTNAYTVADGWFMIGGIDPIEPGCWGVTASYKGATLSYVYDSDGH